MPHVLMVPIRLDALHLTSPLPVVEAKADFTRLPYWNGEYEVNHDIANISEDLVSYPFQDRSLVLPPGVHLHWTLPDALARGSSKDPDKDKPNQHKMLFPAVPNRWLVTRYISGAKKQWIVESDYLHPKDHFPADDVNKLRSVAVPFPFDRNNGERPFRYLGRVRPVPSAKEDDAEYLSTKGYRLTAVGYQPEPGSEADGGFGEPTFAALYANCLSVFGFHDHDPLPDDKKGIKYEIIGWYSNPEQDCLKGLGLSEQARKKTDVFDALKNIYGWEASGAPDSCPDSTFFYASIELDKQAASLPEDTQHPLTVAAGNTVTEALSAYLPTREELKGLPENLEEQLEALHLADRIDHLTLDFGPKFQHARHERGFSSVPGGTIWTIRVASKTAKLSESAGPAKYAEAAETVEANATLAPTLPEGLAHGLNRLNIAQRKFDLCTEKLDSMQKQLFADWYKYMLSAYPPADARDDYPDIDEVRYFIEKNDLAEIEKQIAARESARLQCEQLKNELTEKLQAPLVLQPKPAPRYHRPHEPVLLLAGDGLRMTDRHGRVESLKCTIIADENGGIAKLKKVEIDDVKKFADAIKGKLTGGTHDDPPGTWHPFSLDWSVEMWPITPGTWPPFSLDWSAGMWPIRAGNNLTPHKRSYAPNFITNNYTLDSNNVDLTLQHGKGAVVRAASIYTGSSLITPHAKLKLRERINVFLSKRLLKKYFEDAKIPADKQTDDYFEKNVAAIKDWYKTKKTEEQDKINALKKDGENKTPDDFITDRVVDTMLQVADCINDDRFHVLAQSLTGFNEALLMHKQTLQLPMDEPFGFNNAKEFTGRVRKAVGKNTYVAPRPLDDFQAIRTGKFKILALRLVDTFGRTQDIDLEKAGWVTSELMKPAKEPGVPRMFSLPPRLAQPARLLFQWLAGKPRPGEDEVEMNSHPALTPVCGWLLPNRLDNSLMVYAADGKAVDSISANVAGLLPAHGEFHELPKYFQELVQHLQGLEEKALKTFFDNIETSLQNINPAGSSQHDALALLMGRPIAVVRARLKLELRGDPAINQGWDAFRSDVASLLQNEDAGKTGLPGRSSDDLTKVRFQVRLGDNRQLNDGLLGYWIEYEQPDSRYSRYHSGNEALIDLSIDDGAVTLTMLMDPRGVVHISSGILPAEVLEIPVEQYAASMRAIEVTFLTAPVLSPAKPPQPMALLRPSSQTTPVLSPVLRPVNYIGLPLPDEADHAWSWLEKDGGEWAEPSAIGPAKTQAAWDGPLEIHEGWLRLTNTNNQSKEE